MDIDYIYDRKDGGTTYCYGKLVDDDNFSVVCEDEWEDGIWADRDPAKLRTWKDICQYLEENYSSSIEQIETV